MQAECLPNVKTGKIILWLAVHAYGNQGADKCEIGDNGRGLSFFNRIHGFKVRASMKGVQKKRPYPNLYFYRLTESLSYSSNDRERGRFSVNRIHDS